MPDHFTPVYFDFKGILQKKLITITDRKWPLNTFHISNLQRRRW